MATAHRTKFARDILAAETNEEVVNLLQRNLVNFVDLGLLLKQAHWNVVGPNFRSVHLQLDEIIETVRDSGDEIAERISTLGVAPDGRSKTVAQDSDLKPYSDDFVSVPETIRMVADVIKTTIDTLRASIEKLGDLDPITEDMCIGISAAMEKHLWMLQAQEV